MILPISCPSAKKVSIKTTVSCRSLCHSIDNEIDGPQLPKTFSRPKLLSSIRISNSFEKSEKSSSSISILFGVKPSFSMIARRKGDSNPVSKEDHPERIDQKRKTQIRPTLDFASLSKKWKKKGSESLDSKLTEGEIEDESAKNSVTKPLCPAVDSQVEQKVSTEDKPFPGISFKQLLDCDLKYPIRLDLDQLKEKMKLQGSSSNGIKPILVHSPNKQFFHSKQPPAHRISNSKSVRHEESSTDQSASSKRVSFSRNMMVRIYSRE